MSCSDVLGRCDGGGVDEPLSDGVDGSDRTDEAAALPTLALPGRFHLVNRGGTDVYLGLRFADRCAFDYALRGPAAAVDGAGGAAGSASDAGDTNAISAPLVVEAPDCPCHPSCDDCASGSCGAQSCTELCDESPPRISPGSERVLAWDGRTFTYQTACSGARCASAGMAPAGVYDLSVPIFDRPVAPDSGIPPTRTVQAEFSISMEGAGDTDIEIAIGL